MSTASLDPQFIPAHLRPFLLPAVRRLYIDTPTPSLLSSSSSPPSDSSLKSSTSQSKSSFPAIHIRDLDASAELIRLRAQNAALLSSCAEWRRRAETYAATRVGLATFARIARNYAYDMHSKEKEIREKYECLKRKYEPDEDVLDDGTVFQRFVPFMFSSELSLVHKSVTLCSDSSPYLAGPSSIRSCHQKAKLLGLKDKPWVPNPKALSPRPLDPLPLRLQASPITPMDIWYRPHQTDSVSTHAR